VSPRRRRGRLGRASGGCGARALWSASWSGFTIKSLQDFATSQPVQPALEVCVVGKCHGASLMLTDQVQLLVRKRMQWKGGLVAIPETEENDKGLGLRPLRTPVRGKTSYNSITALR